MAISSQPARGDSTDKWVGSGQVEGREAGGRDEPNCGKEQKFIQYLLWARQHARVYYKGKSPHVISADFHNSPKLDAVTVEPTRKGA